MNIDDLRNTIAAATCNGCKLKFPLKSDDPHSSVEWHSYPPTGLVVECTSKADEILADISSHCAALEQQLAAKDAEIARLKTTLRYPRFGDTATLFEKCVEMLEQRDAKLAEITGENWQSLYKNHFRNAIENMRAALAETPAAKEPAFEVTQSIAVDTITQPVETEIATNAPSEGDAQ